MSKKEPEVSARERIENLWSRGFAVGPYLDAYRDEVAHELAEKIRDTLAPGANDWADYTGPYPHGAVGRVAALIDPEAE